LNIFSPYDIETTSNYVYNKDIQNTALNGCQLNRMTLISIKMHELDITVKKLNNYKRPKFSLNQIWGSQTRKICIVSQYETFGVV